MSTVKIVEDVCSPSNGYQRIRDSKTEESIAALRILSFQHIQSSRSTEAMANTDSTHIGYNRYDDDGDVESAQESRRSQRSKARKPNRSRSNSTKSRQRQDALKEYKPSSEEFIDNVDIDELVEDEIYIVKQRKGYLSILFSMVQTVVLTAMMIQCSIAPFQINPMIGPPPDALDYWGGKNALKILEDDEWWRLVTPIFLHAGIIHLFCNVSVQLDVGAFFEREWGSAIWLFIYVTSGVGSSILSVCFKPNNISVGSSGAVMGLFGGKLGEIFCRSCESKKSKQGRVGHEVRKEQFGAVMCSVSVVMAFSFVPFVDWAAHLGGLVAGFTSSFLCFAPSIKTKKCAVLWFIIGLAMNAAFYGGTIGYMLNNVEPMEDLKDICEYYKQYFEGYECACQLDN